MDRRKFIKTSLYSLGGIATATAGSAVVVPMAFKENMHFDPNDSFWALEKSPESPSLSGNASVDVAIIGGGLTGLFAAYHFAVRFPKMRIMVLEAKQAGHGASGKNGGMVLPQTPNESFEINDDEETHKYIYDLTSKAISEIRDLTEKEGGECDLILDGYLHTIRNNEDIEYYEDYVEKATKMGMALEFLTRKETADEIGTSVYAASVYDPMGGQVHPLKLVHLLKKSLIKKGIVIHENSPVISIEEGSPVMLNVGMDGFQVKAGNVILATDAYTTKLGFFRNNIIAMHTQCAMTKPISREKLSKIGWKSRLPYFDSWNNLFHLILTPDNRICIGGGNAEYFFNNGSHYKGDIGKIGIMLHDEIARIYPSLSGIEFESVWNGILGMTSDGEPSVGATGRHENIFYGLAYNGQGITMTYLFGKIMADIFNGQKDKWKYTPFLDHQIPFIPPEPLRWMGVRLALSHYRRKDRD